MRYDTEHKQRTRERVLKAAAKAIRVKGPGRIGVAEVMAEVGLTHGGFYAHFQSKDDLIAAAMDQMFDESRARLRSETEGRSATDGLQRYIDFYLSPAHRDARQTGCTLAALASDMPRMDASLRKRFSDASERLVAALAALLETIGTSEPADGARSAYAEMLGALSIARLQSDTERSNKILATSRAAIKRRLGLKPHRFTTSAGTIRLPTEEDMP